MDELPESKVSKRSFVTLRRAVSVLWTSTEIFQEDYGLLNMQKVVEKQSSPTLSTSKALWKWVENY